MKKSLILASMMFALPFMASAASFVITPSSGSYTTGKTVTLHISVDPAGSTIYTAMFDAKFSPSTFEVVSFTMNDSMLAMKQASYDSTDNVNGVLVKTGGYTGGINSVTPFGTLVLKTKGSGTGTVTINSSSKLLDSNNVNKQIGSQVASFTIIEKVPVKAPVVTPKALVKKTPITVIAATPTSTDIQQVAQEVASTAPAQVAVQPVLNTQVAAAVTASSPSYTWVWILLIIVVIVGIGLWIYSRRSSAD